MGSSPVAELSKEKGPGEGNQCKYGQHNADICGRVASIIK
jgi:hypothetical protein